MTTVRSALLTRGFVFLLVSPLLCAQQGPAAPVEVEAASEIRLVPTKPVLGTTEPKRRSVLAAAIEGYVIDYPIEEGVWVKQGDVITRLRETILRLRQKEAEAAVREIEELHEQAKLDLARARQLIDRDAVTQKELDAAQTGESTLALRLPQAEARLAVIQADIEKKTVTAPYDGQIVKEHAQVGEWVSRGGAVATLVDLSSVYVRINVPERQVRFVSTGQQVRVQVQAADEERFKGKVVSVLGEGDAEARTFGVRVEIANDGRLKAGMSATVDVPAGVPRRALAIAKDAINLRGRQSFVFVVGKDSQVEERRVELGAASGSLYEVLSGLEPGDRVVIRGNELLRPGRKVRLVSSGAPTTGDDSDGDDPGDDDSVENGVSANPSGAGKP